MFGKILGIDGNTIRMINNSKKAEIGLINYNVIFFEGDIKFVGVISNIDEEIIETILIGEIQNNRFITGILKKPKITSGCRLITKSELEILLGSQDYSAKDNLLLGESIIYDNYKVTVNKNTFLSNHFAVLGNTGAGKSCGVARMLQNIFYYNDEKIPNNAHVVIFDAFGEYDSALSKINEIPGVGYKKYNCSSSELSGESLKYPTYFLGVTELALLLDAESIDLIPVIENTLRITYIFTSSDDKIKTYKNSIIARSIQDILSSGKLANQMVDQIIAVLTKFNTEELNLNSIISQPGYDRTLRQCLNINEQGKIAAMNLVIDFLQQFTQLDIDQVSISGNFYYTLEDLYHALEFSLINEGILSSSQKYDKLNTLKVRLRSIINSDIKRIFEYDGIITKPEYIRQLFKKNDGSDCQIVDINFDELDERYAKTLTKIFAKLFYDFTTHLENRTSYPIHIIIEEAHRYVSKDADNDINVIGYNIFEKIMKIGRKYGLILGLITQRPSELSSTLISQCSNFIIFRLYHPADIKLVLDISNVITQDTDDRIKVLHPGTAYCFGTGFKIPVIVKFELPNPMPKSTNVKINDIWYQ